MNLLTSINSEYLPFGKIFFNSLLKLDDYKKINKIYVIDGGMTDSDKTTIETLSNKIIFIESETKNIKNAKIHSDKWVALVSNKTKTFLELIKKNITPLIFVDIDCYFKENFLHLIDLNSDIFLCERSKPEFNRYDYELTHIGSFFGVSRYNDEIKKFMESWINEMLHIKGKPIETPALCEILRKYDFDLKISNIQEDLVSCHSKKQNLEKFNDCKIFHMKSTGPSKYLSIVDSRISRLSEYIDVNELL